jgi:hypothetical protein
MSLLENKIAVGTVSAVLPGAKILIYDSHLTLAKTALQIKHAMLL